MKLDKKTSIYIGGLSLLAIIMLIYLFQNFDMPSWHMPFWSGLTSSVRPCDHVAK